jgi:CDP-diacylglycerol--serine O-phosphatidyltransferase
MIYLTLLPISFLHYQKLKKENEDDSQIDDEDQEDIL